MPATLRKQRLYEDLVEDIRRQIRQGLLRADHYLLPESELAQKYELSSRAVRQGLSKLESEGLIRRYQGRGTVVLPIERQTDKAKPSNVAVIFQGRVSDSSTAEELDEFQRTFQEEGYGTTLYVADDDPEKETQIVQQLATEGVPGLVLYTTHPRHSFAHLKAAQDQGVKIAIYDHDFPDLDCNFAGIDDRLAAYEATEHLLRLGCQELLMINARREFTSTQLRQQGFEEGAATESLVPTRVIQLRVCRDVRHQIEHLRGELRPILQTARRPLGVFVWCDEVALQTIDCLEDAGWSVPDDARVIGLGNARVGAIFRVPLTTMDVPRREIAHRAAAALVNQMRFGDRAARRVRLKARMIIRQSCGTYPRPGTAHRLESSAHLLEPLRTHSLSGGPK